MWDVDLIALKLLGCERFFRNRPDGGTIKRVPVGARRKKQRSRRKRADDADRVNFGSLLHR